MRLTQPHPVKVWAGVILFFGVGAAIALVVAFQMIGRGSSIAFAITMGAFAGGLGAWFVFYIVLNALKTIDRLRPRAGHGGGVAGG
jgi:hypothetical protein